MGLTKRAQLLMEPDDYQQLVHIAQYEQISVAELIRTAVRERYLTQPKKPEELVEAICAMNLEVIDWESLEADITEAHGESLS